MFAADISREKKVFDNLIRQPCGNSNPSAMLKRWRDFCEYTASTPKNKLCRPSRDSQFIFSHRALPCPATVCIVPAGLAFLARPHASCKPQCAGCLTFT